MLPPYHTKIIFIRQWQVVAAHWRIVPAQDPLTVVQGVWYHTVSAYRVFFLRIDHGQMIRTHRGGWSSLCTLYTYNVHNLLCRLPLSIQCVTPAEYQRWQYQYLLWTHLNLSLFSMVYEFYETIHISSIARIGYIFNQLRITRDS